MNPTIRNNRLPDLTTRDGAGLRPESQSARTEGISGYLRFIR